MNPRVPAAHRCRKLLTSPFKGRHDLLSGDGREVSQKLVDGAIVLE